MKELNVGAGEAVRQVARNRQPGRDSSVWRRAGPHQDPPAPDQFHRLRLRRLARHTRSSHPRNYGTYPRVLGRYVRESKALTWQDAVRKMTLLPAVTIGMIDRGAIALAMVADITSSIRQL